MDLVTVIVPIYNTEEYLASCIESIINQTYRPIQLILVNDGSKDSSLSICQSYAHQHSFIEVYSQENQGVSIARNTGLKHTKGKWVFFVDSDDLIAPDYIKHFMELGDYPFIGGGYTENDTAAWQYQVEHCVLTMDEYKQNVLENFSKIPSVHVAGNRYLHKIIAENNLTFDRGVVSGEDLRFNIKYFKFIDTLCASPYCEYLYTMRDGSSTHTFWPHRLEEERTECQARESLLGSSDDFHYVRYIHWHTTLQHFYTYSDKKHPESKLASKKLKEAMKDAYFRQSLRWIFANGSKDMKLAALCIRLGSYKLYVTLLNTLPKIKRLLRR